jgi:hypothetical protein
LFAVDIAGFTGPHRDDDIRLYLHEELYQVLHKAFDGSGIPWADCFCEDRGDGALIVVPPAVPCKGLIDPLPERLRSLIRRHNHVSRDAAGIQLRAAAHIGPVEHDGHGFVGTDINLLFRMLDARPLKAALAGSGAELGLIVSDYVYRNVVCRYPQPGQPGRLPVGQVPGQVHAGPRVDLPPRGPALATVVTRPLGWFMIAGPATSRRRRRPGACHPATAEPRSGWECE